MKLGKRCTILFGKESLSSGLRKEPMSQEQNEKPNEDAVCFGIDQERIAKENRRASLLHELYYYIIDDPSFIKKCTESSTKRWKHGSRSLTNVYLEQNLQQ